MTSRLSSTRAFMKARSLPIAAALTASCGPSGTAGSGGQPQQGPPDSKTVVVASDAGAHATRTSSWNGTECNESLACAAGLHLRDGRCVYADGMPCLHGCSAVDSTSETGSSAPPRCRTLISRAASQALQDVDLADCKRINGSTGAGVAAVTFSSAGEVIAMRMLRSLSSPQADQCVASQVRGVRIPAFRGDELIVTHAFVLR